MTRVPTHRCEGCGLTFTTNEQVATTHTVAAHACGGDDRACLALCPVPEPCGPIVPVTDQEVADG